jgi:hypothetical protein
MTNRKPGSQGISQVSILFVLNSGGKDSEFFPLIFLTYKNVFQIR